jgi:predicted O-methyltransferase YrrM
VGAAAARPPAHGRSVAAVATSQIARDARDRFLRKVLRREVLRPWMRHRELDLLVELLRRQQPRRCLEWGAGYSTAYFPSLLHPAATWLAVEHDGAWSARVAALSARAGTTVAHVAPNRYPWSDTAGEGTCEDLRDYVEHPVAGAPYDFILVDGRARPACWAKAVSLLAPDGVLVLHDANRALYAPLCAGELVRLVLRDRRRTSGGVCIASRRSTLAGLVDAAAQERLWAWYRRAGAVIHL